MTFSEECLARGWTVTELPQPQLWLEGALWLGCARLCSTGCSWRMGQVTRLSNDIDSTVTNMFKQDLAVEPSQVVGSHATALCTMDDILCQSIWRMISPLRGIEGRGSGHLSVKLHRLDRGQQVQTGSGSRTFSGSGTSRSSLVRNGRRRRHHQLVLLQGRSVGLVGKPGRRSTIVPG